MAYLIVKLLIGHDETGVCTKGRIVITNIHNLYNVIKGAIELVSKLGA